MHLLILEIIASGQANDPAKANDREQFIERRNALKVRLKQAQDRAETAANKCEAISHDITILGKLQCCICTKYHILTIRGTDRRLRDMTTGVSTKRERATLYSAAQEEVAQYIKLLKEYLTMLESQSHKCVVKSV